MKITIVGLGYVGLSNGILLAQNNEVCFLDINQNKVDLLNSKISPIKDEYIEHYLQEKELNYIATTDMHKAYQDAEYIVISVPTDYDDTTDTFDVSILNAVIKDCIEISPNSTIIIKSTVPIGFTSLLKQELGVSNIIFSPEFLREGKALYDNLYPSRIIMGDKSKQVQAFANLLKEGTLKEHVPILCMESTEAEAVKLFANTYLAMRVAYFNELDTYAESHNLNTQDIIKGVCLDPRIGDYYNNPSFGYGGYCLPKDTKQLKANYLNIPNNLISAIVQSNQTRKDFITQQILDRNPNVVGIYRLVMKEGSDNFRKSAVFDIIDKLVKSNVKVIVYEPILKVIDNNFIKVDCLKTFKSLCDLIITNRNDKDLLDIEHKVYTRDLFKKD
ncbi:nucleotide sugar dehydrogenase [Francisella sp. SYW-9]|uniref:nucleotide sugar dehydrogenase n=1 Tax=Francisella sp. SYW-9 TaxID=2610888 RepID=UPI00123D7F8C|nr:nucleotide sugar dehydrogenase [Francisella sp. SYW-9]